jgi:hypothetical protein
MTTEPKPDAPKADLDRLAGAPQPSLFVEFLDFLAENKKWWLLPILIVIGLFGILAALAASPAAPFIYTLF